MKICLLEPFYSGSHQSWAEGYRDASTHEITILKLPGRHWKWRMHGGALSLSKQYLRQNLSPDIIIASDMLDLSVFLSLTRKKTAGIPTAIYFHENQLTYPWSPGDPDVKLSRDNHYAFINYASALSADKLFFNSQYHLKSFLGELPNFLNQFPDNRLQENVEVLKTKSEVLPLGLNLKKFDAFSSPKSKEKINILWNHRWEYDKGPDEFFQLMSKMSLEGLNFNLSVVGESYKKVPDVFSSAKSSLKKHITHFGFSPSFEKYSKILEQSHIIPVTSNQDFFGGSVVEAIYCRVYPLLPARLAYPEHIPFPMQSTHLYSDKNDLEKKLRDLLTGIQAPVVNESLVKFVSKYDWSILHSIYDRKFESINI